MLRGTHRRILSLCLTFRRHRGGTAREFFEFKTDSKCKHMKFIHCTDHRHLPDSLQLEILRGFVEKLTRYFRSSFIKEVRCNHEGYNNIFLF